MGRWGIGTSIGMEVRIAILAAGKGTRMRSALPKVLHQVMGRSLLAHVLAACRDLGKPYVIVGHGAQQVQAHFADQGLTWVEQREQKGTGHALQQLLEPLVDFRGRLLVLTGDAPLLRRSTLEQLINTPGTTILTAQVPQPQGYGRVFCDEKGFVSRIIEEKDCTPPERRHNLVNAGVYCFEWQALAPLLTQLTPHNAQGEYYLTEVFQYLAQVQSVVVDDWQEVLGVNDRLQLSQAGQILNRRTIEAWLYQGVHIVDPATTTIESTVELAADVVIEPGSHLRGQTQIASGAVIGPGSLIKNSRIGAGAEVLYSVVQDSQLGEGVTVGPYAHIRAGSVIGDRCRLGNFVEVKNSQLGNHTNAAHLSYLGDSVLGSQVNIGAGTITANYDGFQKNLTVLEDGVKTGSNSVLIAPISVGAGAVIGAGSVIDQDVPAGALAIARPRPTIKLNYQPKPRKSEGGP